MKEIEKKRRRKNDEVRKQRRRKRRRKREDSKVLNTKESGRTASFKFISMSSESHSLSCKEKWSAYQQDQPDCTQSVSVCFSLCVCVWGGGGTGI